MTAGDLVLTLGLGAWCYYLAYVRVPPKLPPA